MKVLAIMGSPRKKGNTYKAVESIKEELLKKDSTLEFEYLFLADSDIKMCRGCFMCFAKGRERCPLDDELDAVYEKMMAVDGIILAAPTYAMGVPALMKNFIDRLSYTLHRPCFFDQSFLSVSTVGGVMGLKQTLNQLSLLSACSKKSIKLGIAMPPFDMPMLTRGVPGKIKKAADKLYNSMSVKKRHEPGFGDFAYFGAFKAMTSIESSAKECPADFAYYNSRNSYFYPVGVGKSFLGRHIASMMKSFIRIVVKE